MKITTSEAPGCAVVTVEGELDIYTAPALRGAIAELVRAGVHDLVIDLTQVEFLDSTGLGVLVGVLKRAKANHGSLQLVFTQERLMKLFVITGLTRVFVICDTMEAALSSRARAVQPLGEGDETAQPA